MPSEVLRSVAEGFILPVPRQTAQEVLRTDANHSFVAVVRTEKISTLEKLCHGPVIEYGKPRNPLACIVLVEATLHGPSRSLTSVLEAATVV